VARAAPTARFAWCLFLILIIACCVGSPSAAFAIGNEALKRGSDLELTIDSRWCGNASGGYYPVRLKVLNKGPERTFTFRFTGQGEATPAVFRTLTIAQNATVRFTLSIPCVSAGTYGELQVVHEGRPIQGLATNINLPEPQTSGQSRPALLVISPVTVNCDMFEAAVDVLLGSSSAYGGYGGGYSSLSSDHESIRPDMLPQSWVDYSGIDIVAIPFAVLQSLGNDERAAMLNWVHTGGTLLVYEAGRPLVETEELDALLEFDRHAASGTEWKPADASLRRSLGTTTIEYSGTSSTEGSSGVVTSFNWPEDAFASRNLLLGNVYAFAGNPFPGSPDDWAWFINSAGMERLTWTGRLGMSARTSSDNFLDFLIPSVKGVPVGAFLVLITLFTVVIGPLNYIYFWKRRRLYLLVFTIPLIALATSLTLFAYSAIAHGFSTRSRMRSLTLLDQQAGASVTLDRLSLYSGLAPSSGLTFSSSTAVFPIWPPQGQFQSGNVNWSESQSLQSGWLKSRMRTQFFTINHSDQRGRLECKKQGNALQLTNGLEWDISTLVVADADGVLYYGTDIPAGAIAELQRATTEQRRELAARAEQHAPGPPDYLSNYDSLSGGIFAWNSYFGSDMETHFDQGLLEQNLATLNNIRSPDHRIAPSSYVAVLAENPGVETGLESTRDELSLHVLVGYY
jgi:hypothetical protein